MGLLVAIFRLLGFFAGEMPEPEAAEPDSGVDG